MKIYLGIMIGGALGALARYLTVIITAHYLPQDFPWGTWIVNILGCFLIGLFSGIFLASHEYALAWRALLITGFLGAYTTFSTFTYENVLLLLEGNILSCVVNGLSSVLVGIVMCYVGMQIPKIF